MIPIDQTTFGAPEGNCFAACIASLLHMSRAGVLSQVDATVLVPLDPAPKGGEG